MEIGCTVYHLPKSPKLPDRVGKPKTASEKFVAPTKHSAMKSLLLFLLCLLTFLCTCVHAQTQIGSDIVGDTPGFGTGTSLTLSANATRLIVGSTNGSPDDFVAAYDLIDGEWVRVGRLLTGRGNGSDHNVVSVSADGNRLAYGEPTRDDSQGQVYIHNWMGEDWDAGTILGGASDDDGFGEAIALSADGNTLVVGSPDYETAAGNQAGGVRVFRYSNVWEEITGDFAVGNAGDQVGNAVQVNANGNRIAYSVQNGSFNEKAGAGYIDVFDYDGSTWSRVGQAIGGTTEGDRLGYSLSMTTDGEHLAIGGVGEPWVGIYRVVELAGDNWQTVGEEYRGDFPPQNYLGENIILSDDGETLILTNLVADGPTGIFIENLFNGSWTTGPADLPGTEDGFGFATALAGSTLAFSHPNGQVNGESRGIVRVYDIAELTPIHRPTVPLAQIWPNPVDDLLNVSGVAFSGGFILDGYGRKVRTFNGGTTVSTAGLPAGAYFLRLQTEQGWAVGRFVRR